MYNQFKTVEACETFMKNRGYEVIYSDMWANEKDFDIVCLDEDINLIFVTCKYNTIQDSMKDKNMTRAEAEQAAIKWLKEHQEYMEDNYRIRFDSIAICDLGGGKAFLRHHINCYENDC